MHFEQDDAIFKRYFRHAHFKGGSTTTTRNIPAQTANEASLESGLMNYDNAGLSKAGDVLNQGVSAIGETYNPDWSTLYNNFQHTSDDYLSQYSARSDGYLNQYKNTMDGAIGDYKNSAQNYLSDYQGDMKGMNDQYTALTNGELPVAYAAARKQALNSDLTGTVGTAISGLGSRGILNSSVTNSAMNNISQNASDTLAKNYSNDLQTESSLLGQKANNASTYYGNRMSNANGVFGNTSTYANNLFSNQNAALNSLYGNAAAEEQAKITNNASAQTASYTKPTSLLSYASQLATPSHNQYSTMYAGRMGTGSTTQTSNDGGASAWKTAGSIGSAMIMCFVGKTIIRTPKGLKRIDDIKPGDDVYSLDDNDKICIEKVLQILPPHMADIVEASFDNEVVIETTESQRFYTSPWFEYVERMKKPGITFDGNKTPLVKADPAGRKDLVYDIVVSGRNIFFANGIAVEGLGD
jgi:hypothetical protein